VDPLLTDLYELTMAAALLAEGRAEVPATFSLFIRRLPPSRAFLVAAGLDDALAALADFHFTGEDVATLARVASFEPQFLEWLRDVRFTGRVRAVPEGRIIFANEPLLEVEAPFAVAQLLETCLLNIVTLQTTLATKAARCRHAASGRTLVDFSLRRTQGADAGMKVARVCALTGFAATSNVAAAAHYGLPASGTMAHSYITAHESEIEAFRSFVQSYRGDPVLLVDTWDTPTGIDHAIQIARELAAAGRHLAGVRLDSGDLVAESRLARDRLDGAGLTDVAIFASGGLDEYEIDRLLGAGAPIDGFGVGTNLGVSADAPTLESVYKLVEVDGRPVAKRSPGKATLPGAKQVWRRPGFAGDVIGRLGESPPESGAEPLLVEMTPGADSVAAVDPTEALAKARRRFESEWTALPEPHKRLVDPAGYSVELSSGLQALSRRPVRAGMTAREDRSPA